MNDWIGDPDDRLDPVGVLISFIFVVGILVALLTAVAVLKS